MQECCKEKVYDRFLRRQKGSAGRGSASHAMRGLWRQNRVCADDDVKRSRWKGTLNRFAEGKLRCRGVTGQRWVPGSAGFLAALPRYRDFWGNVENPRYPKVQGGLAREGWGGGGPYDTFAFQPKSALERAPHHSVVHATRVYQGTT